MEKITAHILVAILLMTIALPVFAQTIPNFLGSTDFCALLTKIAGGVGSVISALGTIAVVISGILYLLSAGNPNRMEIAKKALIYACIGIALGLAAKGIVNSIKNIIGASGGTC